MKKVIYSGKRNKKLNEVKSIKNITKNLQIFVKISPVQKEGLPSSKLQNHAYE